MATSSGKTEIVPKKKQIKVLGKHDIQAGYKTQQQKFFNRTNRLRKKCKVKYWYFQSHKAHRAVLISVSLALSQTPAYTARPWIRG